MESRPIWGLGCRGLAAGTLSAGMVLSVAADRWLSACRVPFLWRQPRLGGLCMCQSACSISSTRGNGSTAVMTARVWLRMTACSLGVPSRRSLAPLGQL